MIRSIITLKQTPIYIIIRLQTPIYSELNTIIMALGKLIQLLLIIVEHV